MHLEEETNSLRNTNFLADLSDLETFHSLEALESVSEATGTLSFAANWLLL